jgi:predicted DsbA family dithiol-disulfide isomerase
MTTGIHRLLQHARSVGQQHELLTAVRAGEQEARELGITGVPYP